MADPGDSPRPDKGDTGEKGTVRLDSPSYLAGWNDAKAGRQYGEGRAGVQPLVSYDEHPDFAHTRMCGVVSLSGPNREPLACGYPNGHDGPHAWATLPTFTPSDEAPASDRSDDHA